MVINSRHGFIAAAVGMQRVRLNDFPVSDHTDNSISRPYPSLRTAPQTSIAMFLEIKRRFNGILFELHVLRVSIVN